ncbi:MAG: dihydropyrimidinase [Oscillospiraceae bacterium]|nr:dihydropyrimidinase [Oscillospiraceae bacterium]
MYDLLIQNGKIVTPSSVFTADLAVKDQKIAAIGKDLGPAEKTVDAAGKYVLPGAIDAHTHLAMPFGGTVSSDGYGAGTRAAACGGTTTVFDYAPQIKGHGIVESVEARRKMAENEACVDYAFHCYVTDMLGGKLLEEWPDIIHYGVTSIKCCTVYKKEHMMVTDGEIVQILQRGKETGMLTNVHCENPDVIDLNTERFLKEGKTSAWYHYLSRPEFVEAEADKRVIHWAKSLNAPVYIVHLANKEGMDEVTKAKDEGYPIYAETCPQYLHFTCEVYKRPDGRNFTCSPPMKGQASQDVLWAGIQRGDIDTIATDHCPFQSYEKDWGKDDFTKVPNGCAGIENMYPYMLAAANSGRITFEKAVELCCANPAHIFGCPRKGLLEVGRDADIVVYDPEKDFTITQKAMHSDSDHTIWEGLKLHGYPVQTYSRGKLVYNNGEFVGQYGWGKYIHREPHRDENF